jgi:hypothetical protein
MGKIFELFAYRDQTSKNKKTGENSPEIYKISLTNENGYDMMAIHSVLLCPNVAILIW